MPDVNGLIDAMFEPSLPGDPLTITELILRLLLALLFGAFAAVIYRLTQRKGEAGAPSFIATLVLLSVLLAMVTQVIGNNAARAFSLVGILSIVRFRTTVDDTRDTAFVILAVIVGMASGVGNWEVALVGLGVIAFAALGLRYLPLGAPKPQIDWTLQLRLAAGAGAETPWEAVLAKHCEQFQLTSTATVRQGAALDLTYRLRMKANVAPMQLLGEVNRIEGIQNVEMKRNT